MGQNEYENSVLSSIIITDRDNKVLFLFGYIPVITAQISTDDFFACTVAMEELAQARRNYQQQEIEKK